MQLTFGFVTSSVDTFMGKIKGKAFCFKQSFGVSITVREKLRIPGVKTRIHTSNLYMAVPSTPAT